jgi:probable rRNA maturation factor
VVLTDDDEVCRLNREYRRLNRTTDVLSFSQREGPGGGLVPGLLGDVVVSVEQAARQSPGEDVEREIARLLAHGLCHLRGYDHLRSGEARAMRAEEARLLAGLGLEPFTRPGGHR